MEMVTLGFPLYQVYYHKKGVRQTNQALAQWEAAKNLGISTGSSVITDSSKNRLSPMGELEECLRTKHDSFLAYSARHELSAENIQFLLKVLNFKKQWDLLFTKAGAETERARMAMYRAAVNIYICMVYNATAIQPINVESAVYKQLNYLFGDAAALVAGPRPSTPDSTLAQICPWDEPLIDQSNDRNERLQMAYLQNRHSFDNGSTEPIINLNEPLDPNDKLIGFKVPAYFADNCFDKAFASVKYMVWAGPWQNYSKMDKDVAHKPYRSF